MLQIKNLTKKYTSGTLAIDHISADFDHGIIGILGPNGSGKTTLLKMIVGNLTPSEGQILFCYLPIQENYPGYCAQLGYMPQIIDFYPYFTTQDFLAYMANSKGLKQSYAKQKINSLCIELSLQPYRYKRLKDLSAGTRKRIGIAQALLNDPKLLVLDEPTAERDPKERIILRNMISKISRHCLVLYSTHIISDIECIADKILILKNGKIHLYETYDTLIARIQNKVFESYVDEKTEALIEKNHIVVSKKFIQQATLLRFISEQPLPNVKSVQPNLDDVYLSIFYKEDLS